MYTLRRITKDFVYNEALGSAYTVVDKKLNREQFDHYHKSHFNGSTDSDANEVVKFIVTYYSIPIYKNEKYYVMTESGKTFECINGEKENGFY